MPSKPGNLALTACLAASIVICSQPFFNRVSGEQAIKATAKVGEGLNATVFETPNGKITVNMPEDMEAGDTLTGTVVAEAAGKTPDEQAQNQDELCGYVVEVKKAEEPPPKVADAPTEKPTHSKKTPKAQPTGKSPIPFVCLLPAVATGIDLVLTKRGSPVCTNPLPVPPSGSSSSCCPGDTCMMPQVGQCGHPIPIKMPGDGRTDDCSVNVGGKPAPILAASPRSTVAKSPTSVVGPTDIQVKKGNKVATGKFNNIAVKLSCPNPVIKQGETTTVTVHVSGLKGLKQPVKLVLENKTPNAVDMEGGNLQTITINPTGNDSQSFPMTPRY